MNQVCSLRQIINELQYKRDMYRYREERVGIVIGFCKDLRNYTDANKNKVNLYDEKNSFIDEFKQSCKLYINQDDTKEIIDYKGRILFQEINKYIDFYLPGTKEKKPLFVFRFSLTS